MNVLPQKEFKDDKDDEFKDDKHDKDDEFKDDKDDKTIRISKIN